MAGVFGCWPTFPKGAPAIDPLFQSSEAAKGDDYFLTMSLLVSRSPVSFLPPSKRPIRLRSLRIEYYCNPLHTDSAKLGAKWSHEETARKQIAC